MSEPDGIRRMRPDEAGQVGELTVEAYVHDGFLTREDSYAERLLDAADRAANGEVWVSVSGGVLAGSVTFCPPGSAYREVSVDGEGEFRMLAVRPDARGHGIARALVESCVGRCRDLGLTALTLCTMVEMGPALGLYQSLGFVRAPERDFTPEPGFTLLAYRLPLPV